MDVPLVFFTNCAIDRTFDGVYVADVLIDGKRYRSAAAWKNVTAWGAGARLETNML